MRAKHPSIIFMIFFLFCPTVCSANALVIHIIDNSRCSQSEQEKNQNQTPRSERIHRVEQQIVELEDFTADGLILDIGGGGEGIIGQLKGKQCIAVDISKRELAESPDGPLLKILMDARELKFLDNTFNTATVFFTFMYIRSTDHEKVFQEVHRVLAPKGSLLIWDVVFPEWKEKTKDLFLFPLTVKLPDKSVTTGYGVHRPEKAQGLAHFIGLGEKTGFDVITQKDNGKWFFLELKKK